MIHGTFPSLAAAKVRFRSLKVAIPRGSCTLTEMGWLDVLPAIDEHEYQSTCDGDQDAANQN
jgi:hypothetical protein